ncbi:MAG: hypothetical protein NTW96_12930 [Planctomycetia bacterium]|nr:hypothetical protein [Planctomycetia bacterium]
MLTEQEISRSWAKLLARGNCNDESLDKAEVLLDELRPESPLRRRLAKELIELRQMYARAEAGPRLAR